MKNVVIQYRTELRSHACSLFHTIYAYNIQIYRWIFQVFAVPTASKVCRYNQSLYGRDG